jgi:hypothetical protein
MGSIGLPELLVMFGVLFGSAFCGFVALVLWRFYQIFGKINENIAGIRLALKKSTLLQ